MFPHPTSLWTGSSSSSKRVIHAPCLSHSLISNTYATLMKQAIFCRPGSFRTLPDFSEVIPLWTTFLTQMSVLWVWYMEKGAGIYTVLDRLPLFSPPRCQWYQNGIMRAWWWCGCAKQQRGSSLSNSSSGKKRRSLTPSMREYGFSPPHRSSFPKLFLNLSQ